MNGQRISQGFTRRDFLRLAGGGLIGGLAGALGGRLLLPADIVRASPAAQYDPPANVHLAGSDGWIYLPPTPIPPYHPDDLAPAPQNTYVFGFRDVTGLTIEQAMAFKGRVQLSAPMFWADEITDPNGMYVVQLSNLGLQLRPDLVDSHTIHWHGFRHAIPFFDGEPMSTFGVPIGRSYKYIYRPRDAGTYMYHCHFEDTEHVHMGMVGLVFVRPALNQAYPGRKFAYNDLTTEYDREFALMLNEVWAEAHWADSHIQLPDWSDYRPDFWLINGRTYPHTILPNGTRLPNGELVAPSGYPELQYQPISSLIQANEGERVLLRIVNLGFQKQTMVLDGIDLQVVGKDATLLRGRDDTDLRFVTNTISVGPGESVDAIFIAPSVSGLTRYLLYNRNYGRLNSGGTAGYGGQMTEIHIYPAGTLPVQTDPNEIF